MLCAKSNRIGGFAALAVFSALFAFGGISAARRKNRRRVFRPAARPVMTQMPLPFNSWLLYPSINFLAENSNNYFLTPQSKQSVVGIWRDSKCDRDMVQWHSYNNDLWQFPTLEYPTNSPLNGDQRAEANVDPAICAIARFEFHICWRLYTPNAIKRSDKCNSFANTVHWIHRIAKRQYCFAEREHY